MLRSTNFPLVSLTIGGSDITIEPLIFAIIISLIPIVISLGYHTFKYFSQGNIDDIIEQEEEEQKNFIDSLVPNTKLKMYLFVAYLTLLFGLPLLLLIVGRTELAFEFVTDLFLFMILSLYILGLKVSGNDKIQLYITSHRSMEYIIQIIVEGCLSLAFIGWLDYIFFA